MFLNHECIFTKTITFILKTLPKLFVLCHTQSKQKVYEWSGDKNSHVSKLIYTIIVMIIISFRLLTLIFYQKSIHSTYLNFIPIHYHFDLQFGLSHD